VRSANQPIARSRRRAVVQPASSMMGRRLRPPAARAAKQPSAPPSSSARPFGPRGFQARSSGLPCVASCEVQGTSTLLCIRLTATNIGIN
jgi:hypothetical protein